MTGGGVLAEDKLFATLDPTMRAIELGAGRRVIISDTVGFVSDLPTQLVAAFRATLEEVLEADLIVHVRDIASPETDAQAEDVREVLAALGIDGNEIADAIEVYNKTDLVDAETRAALANEAARDETVVCVSALAGQGIDRLLAAIDKRLARHDLKLDLDLPLSDGEALAWLYRQGAVLERKDNETAAHLHLTLSQADAERFEKRFAYSFS